MPFPRLLPTLAAAGATCSLLAALTPATATAATGDYYYDGKGPYETGCINGSHIARTAKLGDGANLYLYYSPSCRTVWAGIDHASARTQDNAGAAAAVHRSADGGREICSAGRSTSCHTAMLYDGGFSSYAHGTDDPGFQIFAANTGSY
jgi:hypothetical protein